MAETVFNVEAAKSYIKRFTNAVVFGKTGVAISSTADKSIFFSKVPLSSSHLFLVEIYDSSDAKVGSINFSFTAGKVSYADSCITVLGASSQEMISQTKIIASFNFEDQEDISHVLIGLKLSTYGNLKLTYQVVSSNRAVVTPIALSYQALVNCKEYDVSKGYLLNRALFEETDVLNAFRRWSSTHQYSGNDPVFYGSHLYYASPNSVPAVGEDPTHYPSKWIELATAEIPDTDITKGAETPQLFYHNSLVISNGTAAELRKDHKDVGFEYPSENSKVYHFDEDLLDQNQENSLEDFIQIPQNPEIRPFFVGKGMVGVGISSDPAILFKPLKENPAFYYGNFSIRKTLKLNTENNMFGFHFKYSGIQNFVNEKIIELTFASGEKVSLMINYSEPDYMEDAELPYWDPEEIPSYSQPKTSTPCLTVLTEFNDSSAVEVFSQYPLIEDSWAHLCIEIQSDSITFFFRGQQITLPRKSPGLGNVTYWVNKGQKPFSIDELIWDTSTRISYERYQELISDSLPWAAHEKSENWLVLHSEDYDKTDIDFVRKDREDQSVLYSKTKISENKFFNFPIKGVYLREMLPDVGLCSDLVEDPANFSFICKVKAKGKRQSNAVSVGYGQTQIITRDVVNNFSYDIITMAHTQAGQFTKSMVDNYLKEVLNYKDLYSNFLPILPSQICDAFVGTKACVGLAFKSFEFSQAYLNSLTLPATFNCGQQTISSEEKLVFVIPGSDTCFVGQFSNTNSSNASDIDIEGSNSQTIGGGIVIPGNPGGLPGVTNNRDSSVGNLSVSSLQHIESLGEPVYWTFMGFSCKNFDYGYIRSTNSTENRSHSFDYITEGTWKDEVRFGNWE